MNSNKTINIVFDYLFCLLIVIIPISFAIPNLILVLLIVLFLADYKNLKKIDFSPIKKPAVVLVWSLVLYWYVKDAITQHLTDNKHSLFLLIIILPLLFLKIQNYTRIFVAIVIAGFIIALRASFGLIEYHNAHQQLLPFEGEIINDILNMERPYLGFFSLIAIISSISLAFQYKKYAFLMYAYALLMGFFIFIISARMSSISLLIILLLYLVFYLKTALKNKLIFGFIVLTMVIGVIGINKNIRERLFINANATESVSKFKSYEPRFIIWPCAYDIIQSSDFNHLFGISSEKKIEDLLALGYNKKITNKFRADYYVTIKLNTHNQFLGTYLNSGIIGSILLLGFLVLQIKANRKDFIKTAMVVVLLLFLIVENVLYRQMGVYLFALIIAISNTNLNFSKK